MCIVYSSFETIFFFVFMFIETQMHDYEPKVWGFNMFLNHHGTQFNAT